MLGFAHSGRKSQLMGRRVLAAEAFCGEAPQRAWPSD